MILKILFWVTVILMSHTYVVYPLLLIIADRLTKKKSMAGNSPFQPPVSVLMAVHNEEQVIKQKSEALLASDYTTGKLEVIIGSDASDDRTDIILSDLEKIHPQLKVIRFAGRTGKPAVINRLSEAAGGEILIITDADVMPSADTITRLVSNFSDEQTGLADTRLINRGARKEGISFPETAYIGFEWRLKNIEGRLWGTMMGPFGGFYAVRKSLYHPNEYNIIADDFRICMNVLRQGKRAISDHNAVVYEDASDSLTEEFNRKVRISAGNFQNLGHFASLLLWPFNRISFCFISHKVLRWITPILWLIAVFTNILLLGSSFFYLAFFLLQVIFIILPPLDMFLKKVKVNLVPLRFFTHFYFMNVALFVGFVKYLQGIGSGAWTPTKRNQ
jgi:cellulose synthase/poly-beta-1,6-N-acetylglucosamine synthase-like glycosyltransferase